MVSGDIDVEKMNPKSIAAAGFDAERYRKRPEEAIDYRIRGAMMAFRKASEPFHDSPRECFSATCDGPIMLAMARLAGRGRLRWAGGWSIRQDNLMRLRPHVDSESPSTALKIAGGAIDARGRLYESLSVSGKKLAVDMIVCLSKGRASPIKKVVTDGGHPSTEPMDALHLNGYRFVIPVRSNSELHNTVRTAGPRGFNLRGIPHSAPSGGGTDTTHVASRTGGSATASSRNRCATMLAGRVTARILRRRGNMP